MPPLILTDHVSFRYPAREMGGARALNDISLEIGSGEFVAILGANGSGKTTFARHLNGLLLPERGQVRVGGLDTREKANLGQIRQLVGMVFQHPEDQIVASTVEEDIAFGPENLGLEPARIRRRVEEAIAAVGLEAQRMRPPHLLSGGQMQRLALAGVLAMRPKCVVFDEATTMLDPAGRRMALDLMERLRGEGLTVVFVTHNMEEAALATRVVVLHQGRLVFDGSPREAFSAPGLADWGLEAPPALLLARRLRACVPEVPLAGLSMPEFLQGLPRWDGPEMAGIRPASTCLAQPVASSISVSGLEHTYLAGTPLAHAALLGIDLEVRQGHAHGLAGVTGSGKSTLLQHLNGILRPQRGSVRTGDFQLEDPAVLTRDVVKIAGLVFQNPETQFFQTYAGDEVAYGPRQLGLGGALRERVRRAMESVGLDFEAFKDRSVYNLSGGERRKVALASVLAIEPRFLLLDEPTAGLDPRSHREVINHLRELKTAGVELVVSSHRMDDLAELVDDMTVCRKGRSILAGSAEEVFNRFEALYEAGLEPPPAALAAERLRQLGWPVPEGLVTVAQLETALHVCGEGAA